MMKTLTRRTWLGMVMATPALGCGERTADPPPTPNRAPRRAPMPLDAVLDGLIETDDAIEFCASAVEAGTPPERLLAAAFIAPVLTGRDREDVHAMLAVPAIRSIASEDGSVREDGLVPIIWGADNARMWSARERVTTPAAIDGTGAELEAALRRGVRDEARGRAIGHAKNVGIEATLAILRLEASRPGGDPHPTIFTVQATRMLDEDTPYAAEVVGSVAAFLGRGPVEPVPIEPLDTSGGQPTDPFEIARALRLDPAAPLPGVDAESVWAALALIALEMMLADRAATGVGLHRVTLLESLYETWVRADADRPLVLARARTWILTGARRLIVDDTFLLSTLEPDEVVLGLGDKLSDVRRALAALNARGTESFVAEARTHVLRHAEGAHDFKLWAAVETLAAIVPPPVRTRLLAAAGGSPILRRNGGWVRYNEAQRRVTR